MSRPRLGLCGFLAAAVVAAPAALTAQAALLSSALPRVPPRDVVLTYGTSVTSYADVGEWEFGPIDTATTYEDSAVSTVFAIRYPTAGPGTFLAPLHLPSGAALQSLELDACDVSSSDKHVTATLATCNHVTAACAGVGASLVSVSDAVAICKSYVQDVSALNYVVDNTGDRLLLAVTVAAKDGTNGLAGMRVGYRLTVSPAPATPTFGDVPATSLYFQYIEALAASGVTGGCGGGNYCPDNPVTRAQMAVFLAKALGLQFP
ncbi:MAG TPA: S-layer homology domain-containing protein [Thermoanaerobaculia bacterium]|nr:S-layer homology domain-containing protein [Thermoanaerobaculia bacterium]